MPLTRLTSAVKEQEQHMTTPPQPQGGFPEPSGYGPNLTPPPGQMPPQNQPLPGPGPGPGPQGYPPQQPTGIRLHVQGSVMTNSLVPPRVLIDGQHLAHTRMAGAVDLPTPPGERHIKAWCQWMREYGQAEMVVNVPPGQLVDVFYNPPVHQFTRGNIGLAPQSKRGWGFFIALIAILFVIIFGTIAMVAVVSG